jgi:hypothetical protein
LIMPYSLTLHGIFIHHRHDLRVVYTSGRGILLGRCPLADVAQPAAPVRRQRRLGIAR